MLRRIGNIPYGTIEACGIRIREGLAAVWRRQQDPASWATKRSCQDELDRMLR